MLIYCVICFVCYALHVYMCVYAFAYVHVCVHVYLCSVAMHTFLAGQRGTDAQTASEGGTAWRLFVYMCVCVYQ